MTPEIFLADFLDPGLAWMNRIVGPIPNNGADARMLMLMTPLQETNLVTRLQEGGPAHSFFQFERGGGLTRVMGNPRSDAMLKKICAALCIPYDIATVFQAVIWNDPLAIALARLDYWLDAHAIPPATDEDALWTYYLRNWGPGKPDRGRWGDWYPKAKAAIAAVALPAIQAPIA